MESEQRLCRICSDKSDGAHFGVDSCRACAAFFRRSVTMKKKYVCRQGGHNCIINKTVRCMCRQCRYRKCLEAGMLPEHALKQNSQSEKSQEQEEEQKKCEYVSSSETERPCSSAFYVVNGGPMVSMPYLAADRPTVLHRITENYRHFVSVRKTTERSISKATYKGIFTQSLDAEIIESNFDMLSKMMRVIVPAVAEFVYNTFDGFNELDQQEKWLVFKSFVPFMWTFESSYFTVQQFPEEDEKRYMVSQTSYVDMENPEKFFQSCTPDYNSADVTKLVEKCMVSNKGLVAILRKLKLSETEFIAAVGLLLWNPSLFTIDNPHILSVAEAERSKIFHDLHLYYRNELGLEEYSGRLGEFMVMFCSVQWKITIIREDMELFNLFDVFSSDSFLYDILKT